MDAPISSEFTLQWMYAQARIGRVHNEKAQPIIKLSLKSVRQLLILLLEFWKIFNDHEKTIV